MVEQQVSLTKHRNSYPQKEEQRATDKRSQQIKSVIPLENFSVKEFPNPLAQLQGLPDAQII